MKHLVTLALFLLAAGCSSTTVETKTDPMSTPDGLCQKWAEAACNDTVVSDCAATKPACIATQKSFCQAKLVERYSSLTFVVDKANACVAKVQEAYSDARLTAVEYDIVINFGPPCDTLNTTATDAGSGGGQAGGYPCSVTADCVSGFYCKDGICAVLPGQDQTCCVGFASCAPELGCRDSFYCAGAEGAQTCQARVGLNSPCSPTVPCDRTLVCSNPTNGVCTAQMTLDPTGPVCANLK